MNKQQVVLNTRLLAHGWTKADVLVNDSQPGAEAVVYKGPGNSCITYPDGTFDRMDKPTPKPREGWYSPAAVVRDLARADADVRLIAKIAHRPAQVQTHRQLQRGVKAVIRQLNQLTGGN